MIPMPVTPDQSFDLGLIDASLLKNLVDVLRHVQAGDGFLDEVVDSRCEVPPVFPAPQVEHHTPSRLFVFQVESKGRQIERLLALENRLDEGIGWHHNIAGGVDYLDIDDRVPLW